MSTAAKKKTAKPECWIDPRFRPLAFDMRAPLARLDDGRLMIVTGVDTSSNPVTEKPLVARTSVDEGKNWSKPVPLVVGKDGKAVVKPGRGVPSMCNVILRTSGNVLIVVGMEPLKRIWDVRRRDLDPKKSGGGGVVAMRSLDNGRTWIDRRRVFKDICGNPPMSMIETSGGHVVATCQPILTKPGRNAVCTLVSADQGKTWRTSHMIDLGGSGHHDGVCEPAIVELRDGRLWMLLRTNWGRFWEAFSEDGGLSWRTIRPSRIAASSSPMCLVRLRSGRLALLWNRMYPEGKRGFPRPKPNSESSEAPACWQHVEANSEFSEAPASWYREELSMSFSEDDGKRWSRPLVVAREKDAWISYPYLFEAAPGLLWIRVWWPGGLQVQALERDLVGS